MPRGLRRGAAAGALVAAVTWSVVSLDIDGGQLSRSWENLRLFLDRSLPPDGAVLRPALEAMVETVQMALLATLAAVVLAVPLGLIASRNLVGGPVGTAVRTLLAALRTLPAILWALILVAVVGVGVLAGVLALALYTVGYLGKLHYEAIEGLAREPVEALEASGATRLEVVRHVVLPEMANPLLSHVLFAFEYNVRHASVLGVVGAGGIGTLLMGYLTFFQLDRLVTVLLVVLATVLAIDAASRLVRTRFTDTAESWSVRAPVVAAHATPPAPPSAPPSER